MLDGDPGIGKSMMLLQVAANLSRALRVFLHIPSRRYIPAQTATVELMGTRDNSRTIASKSMISGDFLNS
jgi:predicted ATP-dependent serine protease